MFNDAREVEDNLQACGNLSEQFGDEELDGEVYEPETEHEQKDGVDSTLNLFHDKEEIDCFIYSLVE
jgi:hypothetical protein